MDSKKVIRQHVLETRFNLTEKEWEEKSRRIYEKVVTHPFFLEADSIYSYVDYRREVGTRDIIEHAWKQGKKVAVPKVNGDKMEFYHIQSFEDLKEGYKGIPEPEETQPVMDTCALVLMPGSAFDARCNRIGYGKGYYDKYLHIHPNHKTIALAFELQIVNEIPADTYDICPDIIITEEKTYER